MTNTGDPLARAQNTAHEWLTTVASALGTDDRRYTYRVVRAWLHTFRDRLTVESAAHFAAQLPELLRGIFYDGWVPSKVPLRYSADEYIDRISESATIRRTDVRSAMAGVGDAEVAVPAHSTCAGASRDLQSSCRHPTTAAHGGMGTSDDTAEL